MERVSQARGRVSAEGKVWEVVCYAVHHANYALTVRQIAGLTGLAVGSVHRTLAWRLYLQFRTVTRAENRAARTEHAGIYNFRL